MDDPRQDPVEVNSLYALHDHTKRHDDPSQDPVYVDDPSYFHIKVQDTLKCNNLTREKVAKVNLPNERPSGSILLETLSVDDICYLLDHSQLSAITSVARENQFSGWFHYSFIFSIKKLIKRQFKFTSGYSF